MVIQANCKINLGLHVTARRSDGYHNLETVFYPVGLCDTIGIEKAPEFTFTSAGLDIPGKESSNLCVKAFRLMEKTYGIPSVNIRLLKNIPMGAGLGGGSSDAAAVLKGINELFSLGLDIKALTLLAEALGSDCPFFVLNKPALANGRGEILEPVNLDLGQYHTLIVKPDIHIPTAQAYSKIKPAPVPQPLKEIVTNPPEHWKSLLTNDFEPPVFNEYPEIKQIKENLYDTGAVYAAMSGSGAAVYGIFNKEPQNTDLFRDYFVWKGRL